MKYDITDCLFSKKDYLDVFSSVLDTETYDSLKQLSRSMKVKKGYSIFKEGDSPMGLIYLNSGSAKVFKLKPGKREQIVRLVRHSSFVGYKALFAEKNHTTNASAIEDSEIVIIEKSKLFEIIDNNPAFSRLIIKALANELSFNFERLINLTQKQLRGRLADTLLLMAEIYGFEDDGLTINVKITKENIGFFSNMTTSNAIRTLKSFEKEGLLESGNHQIKLLNQEAIRKVGMKG